MNMGKCLQVEGDFRIKIGLNRTLQCLAFIGARSNSMSHSLNSMHRRSGLKKAHFSSVPTRMSLFTCKKYVFRIEKNFPNLTAPTQK